MIQILVNTSRPGKYLSIFILEKTFSGILKHISLATKGLKIFGQDLEIPTTDEREKSAKPEKPAKSEPAAKPAPASSPEVKAESKPEVHPASETANAVNNLTAIAAGVATSVVNDAPTEDQVQIFNWCFNFITWKMI